MRGALRRQGGKLSVQNCVDMKKIGVKAVFLRGKGVYLTYNQIKVNS